MASRASSVDKKAIKKLPWPKALLSGASLSTRDAYETGRIIQEQLRAERGNRRGLSVQALIDVLKRSHSTLYRAIKIYDVVSSYGLAGKLDELPPTLLHNIERIPKNQRKQFLAKALREGWSKREIVRQITGVPAADSTNKPPKRLIQLQRLSEKLLEITVEKQDYPKAEAKAAKRSIRQMQTHLRKWEKLLG